MSKKQLRNRLENLFANFEENDLPELSNMTVEQKSTKCWSWEADGDSRYVSVSEEVSEVLGLPPDRFIGRSILTFQVDPADQDRLEAALENPSFPVEISLHYLNQKKAPVSVRLSILPRGSEAGYQGYIQLLTEENAFTTLPTIEAAPLLPEISPEPKTKKPAPQIKKQPAPAPNRPIRSKSFESVSGLASINGTIQPASSVWTPTGKESLFSKKVVAQSKENEAPAVIAAPISIRQRGTGLLEIIAGSEKSKWTEEERLLVQEVANQLGLALENAQLYAAVQDELAERVRAEEEVRKALQALEVRERYQANVARSVAMLSESGAKTLPEVLTVLGAAAQASRVYYAQVQEEESGTFWNELAEWCSEGDKSILGTRKLQFMRVDRFSRWSSDLRENGWFSLTTTEANPTERQFLQMRGVQSMLLLAVPGKSAIPSFIGLEQALDERQWQKEEIGVLRVAADALSNTLIREDLLDQLQASLEESESLYATSHNLSLAGDFQEMIAALVEGVQITDINRGELVMFDRDSTGEIQALTVSANWSSGHGEGLSPVEAEYEGEFRNFLSSLTAPTFFDDVADSLLAPAVLRELEKKNVRSMAVLPLWSGKQQLGVLLLQGDQKHHFTGREIRTYPPLIDQMATGIQNRILFEQTQVSLAETQILYKISAGVASATSVQDLVNLVATNVMPKNAQRVSLQLVSSNSQGQPEWLEVVGFFDRTGNYRHMGLRNRVSSFPFLNHLGSSAVTIPDVRKAGLDDQSREGLLAVQIASGCLVPLYSGGRLIGILGASSDQPAEYDPEEVQLFQIAASGISIALERQLLLREAQRRALELQTAAEIARDTSSTLSLDILMKRMVELIRERFNFYHASIFMVDEAGEYAVVKESTGQAGEDMKRRGHKLAVGSRSVIGQSTATGEPTIVNDVTQNPNYYPNPLLPRTHSEIGLPLKISDRVIGALDIQSTEINAFSESEITVLRTLADQIAVAIENARSYELAQKAVEEMREVDRVKSQFLANMSHELRTPLNSIIGFSRVILKGIDGPVNETQEQDLTSIYNSGQHLLNLINDILDLSKIEAGKMELQFTEVNIGDLITSVLSTAMGLVKDKPVQLKTQIEPDLPILAADPTRVRQVLLNFISNAAKFTEQGSITIEAKLSANPKNQPEILVTVTDTGDGIAEEDRSKLFLPFSQVDDSPTRKTGGTGLGLSICRSFIEMHHGRIGLLSSEVGKGSTFFFTLPLPAVEEPTIEPGLEVDSPRCILSIDDDMQVIQLYQRYLQPYGYQVYPLTNPQLAVQTAKEIQPFAITLDVMMPEKDGWMLIHELKNDPETRNTPIIICSILEEEEKGFSLGASDYLVKPFLEEDLINAIHRLDREGKIKEILVVDDSPEDLRLVEKILEEVGGFHVVTAEGGQQALNTLSVMQPDAIIMDLFMPDLNGFSLLEAFRTDPNWQNIPVIILTGADLTPEQHTMLANFGQQMLTKGMLREKDLLNTLEGALKKIRS